MEEYIALDSKKQKKFIKSIKGIKKLINKNNEEESLEISEDGIQRPFSMRLKDSKMKDVRRKKRKQCGLVYLSHIPHGFYEDQMTQYFKQFGLVTNARVIRSKRTGNSKGHAFVEFKEPSVAQIVAETMNNYLMGKRLIKAAYIPPEKQRKAFRKRWSTKNNPASEARMKLNKAYNANKDEKAELKRAKMLLASLNKTKKKLREMGVNYDFFAPVDIPDALLDTIIKKEKDGNTIGENEDKKNVKKEKVRKLDEDEKKIITSNKKVKTSTETNKTVSNNNKIVTENEKEKLPVKVTKKEKLTENVNKKEQKYKQQKMKDAGVKPPEDFMIVEGNSDDSDSSYAFDSDEYEKVLENEDNDISSDESDVSDVNEDDEEENEERISKSPKKLKFEKQNQKTTKKQFKKK